MISFKPKALDRYIIGKFLGTFFFAIMLIIGIAVIFDFSEKVDDFMISRPSFGAVVFGYYLNFIPYFTVLFSSLFIFISVIFFTSKMAYDTEIIAILSSGISFRRLMFPYFISACFLALFSFFLNDYIIPDANRRRIEFEDRYVNLKPKVYDADNVHIQVAPGLFVHFGTFVSKTDMGHEFSMERFENNRMVSKLRADYVRWDSVRSVWTASNYSIRTIDGLRETLQTGVSLDTTFNLRPEEFKRGKKFMETMNLRDLSEHIEVLKLRGADNVKTFIMEKHKRIAFPFSTFILTLIGVSLSTRKVRGGIGVQIAAGITLSFAYILFMQFSAQFAINGTLSPVLAAWIPNAIFLLIGTVLYYLAPK